MMILIFTTLLLLGTVIGISVFVDQQTQDKTYSNLQTVPTKKVALILGTSKYLPDGRINLYFKYRIEAAVQLYKAGKVSHLLVSGDNRTRFYNEPIAMKKSLLSYGIPEEVITLDYAGFRTLDSVVRAKEVFLQDDIIIVSQAFHNRRALYISDFYDMKAVGFNAQDVPSSMGVKVWCREYLARFKMILDLYVLKTQPKFLGEKIRLVVL